MSRVTRRIFRLGPVTRVVLACGLALAAGLALQRPLLATLAEPWWWVALLVVVQALFIGILACTDASGRLRPVRPTDHLLDLTARDLPRIRQVQRLLRWITRTLVRCFGASHATIFLEAPRAGYRLATAYGPARPTTIRELEGTSPLIQWLREHRRALRPQDCPNVTTRNGFGTRNDPYRRLHLILGNLNARLVVPCLKGGRLLGFLALGEPANKRPYTEVEMVALSRMARDCAIALDYATSYEELSATTHKLQSAQDRLIRQERMVAAGRLAMGLAHEIKNPLSAIKTFSEFLPERHNDPKFREEFSQIVGKEVERINRIVQSLSDFAKPILLRMETIDVQKVLKDTVTLLSSDCLKRNVAVRQAFEPEPILLQADPGQMKQAFLNLCMNALEAMEPKGGMLSVGCRLQEGDAVITVTDTGSGISPEHLPVLFDPFFSTKNTGMGLGLAVVKQIVEQHLGTIRVKSQMGLGSVFEVRLPLAVRFTSRQAPARAETPEDAAPPAASVSIDLLVVDDEPKIQELLKGGFEALGASVRVAASGEEALRLVAEREPQLILLDLKLQELDGFEVLKRVKMRHPLLPVIVITGTLDEGSDHTITELGALACFHKPIELPALQRAVADLVPQLPHPISEPLANHPPQTPV